MIGTILAPALSSNFWRFATYEPGWGSALITAAASLVGGDGEDEALLLELALGCTCLWTSSSSLREAGSPLRCIINA